MSGVEYLLAGLAAVGAGIVNALAGGGTLITFPTLTFLGLPAIQANITNTVALCPGYLGGTLAQFEDMRGQKRRMQVLLSAGVIGGVIGGILLLNTSERFFEKMVPFLILLASCLLAVQDRVRIWLTRRLGQSATAQKFEILSAFLVALAAIYGGYFGAGLSVMVLSVLGLTIDDSLTRLNACKQAIAFAVNAGVAVLFLFSHRIVWPMALVMAAGALIGGSLGGRFAGRIKPYTLRWTVVAIGIVVAAIYFVH